MITVFECVIVIVEAVYIGRLIWKERPIQLSWSFIIIPPIAFVMQAYFTYIVEKFYRKCEDSKEEEHQRISAGPVETHAYENQATLRRIVHNNGRVLLETDV